MYNKINQYALRGGVMEKEQKLSILSFSLFSSWLLSFPFEGQILYAALNLYELKTANLIFWAIGGIFIGLILHGFFVKTLEGARGTINIALILCIISTIAFFFPPSTIWTISLSVASLAAGSIISAWGFYYKFYTPSIERLKTVANILIYSNLFMIMINMITIHVSLYTGLSVSIAALMGALYYNNKLPVIPASNKACEQRQSTIKLIKPLIFLYAFILIITINSGLMYQVINPAFQHHRFLVSWYWAVPYITAIYIMKSLPKKINRNYILYVAIAMMGFSFLAFMVSDRSALSYLIVNTLMLGACGVYDLFWWSILGEMLNYHINPAKILGIGLSANVLGILVGCFIGEKIDTMGSVYGVSLLALIIVFATIIILPILHKHLFELLENHIFLAALYEMAPAKQNEAIKNIAKDGKLTQRESEIVSLLLRGRTYKMISDELNLSLNTVKSHIGNIYSKFQVQSKSELMELLTEKGYLENW